MRDQRSGAPGVSSRQALLNPRLPSGIPPGWPDRAATAPLIPPRTTRNRLNPPVPRRCRPGLHRNCFGFSLRCIALRQLPDLLNWEKFVLSRVKSVLSRHPGGVRRHPGVLNRQNFPLRWPPGGSRMAAEYARHPAEGKFVPADPARMPAEYEFVPAEGKKFPAEGRFFRSSLFLVGWTGRSSKFKAQSSRE